MNAEQRAASVRLLVLDVDGVLTDGRLYFGADGEAMKVFDVRDGHGVRLLREAGIEVAILSARRSPIVERRARELGIGPVIQGAADKGVALAELMRALQVNPRQCAYVGDDWPDLPALAQAGFAATVADAAPEALYIGSEIEDLILILPQLSFHEFGVQLLGTKHMVRERLHERIEQPRRRAHPVGQRRAIGP